MPRDLVSQVHRLVAVRPGAVPSAARVAELVRAHQPLAAPDEVEAAVHEVLHRLDGLGALEPLLADPAVTEVMVNGPGRPVWVERDGRLEPTAVVVDRAAIDLAVQRVVSPLGLRVDRASPMVDARLPDGSRVNVVVPPLAVDGTCLTIRRFAARQVPLARFCPPGVAPLLAWAVQARCNVIASGGTGAGKTTLLNALAAGIAPGERVVTVEETAELRLPGEHVVRLEARPPHADGSGAVDIRALVRNALRMRPDRLVVGEVRGPEALDMLQAMNTGHDGSLSTCHANSPSDALARLETMVLLAAAGLPVAAVRRQLASAVDLVVQVARTAGGERRIVAVAELVGGGVQQLADGGGLRRLPSRPARDAAAAPPDPGWVVT